jgi:hypothetical protein
MELLKMSFYRTWVVTGSLPSHNYFVWVKCLASLLSFLTMQALHKLSL